MCSFDGLQIYLSNWVKFLIFLIAAYSGFRIVVKPGFTNNQLDVKLLRKDTDLYQYHYSKASSKRGA